ncbi:MAG: flagellar hook-associated protein FlgK [Limisphaerales bacterium]
MLSLFGVLNMGSESLSVQQEATALAGQNLANVNNPAYADEQLELQEATPVDTPTGEEGTGVDAVSITSLRNALLDSQIAAEDSVTGSLTSQQNALQEAEAYLNEQLSNSSSSSDAATSSTGLTADLSNLFSSLQTLSTDPSNISDRQAVIQSAQQLTEQFNQVSSGLSTVTSNLNTSIQNGVTAVNQDLGQIASLNQQIMEAQDSGGTAEQLVDEREQTIENLAGYVNLTTSAQANGAVNVDVGGINMVTGDTVTNTLATTSSNGPLYVEAVNGGELTLTSGSIEGSMTVRNGAVTTLQNSLDTLAGQLITQVNGVYEDGTDLNGNSGQPFFTGTDAATIGVNSTLVNDPSAFQASSTGEPGDNGVVLAMAQLADTPLSNLNNQTMSQYYSQAVGSFGSSLQSVNEQLANSTSVAQMLTTQRDSASGVNTDTEMTNLLQFQKAYEASAELVTTVNQMLDTLVNMKTV